MEGGEEGWKEGRRRGLIKQRGELVRGEGDRAGEGEAGDDSCRNVFTYKLE